jgi:hypothetical protein
MSISVRNVRIYIYLVNLHLCVYSLAVQGIHMYSKRTSKNVLSNLLSHWGVIFVSPIFSQILSYWVKINACQESGPLVK